MGSDLSIDQMLARLEAKIAHHREQQAFHAQQEGLHQAQKAFHTLELEKSVERFEAFQAAARAAGEMLGADGTGSAAPPSQEEDDDLGQGRPLSRMIARIVEGKGPLEVFGASAVTQEIHERWGSKLRRRVNPRSVAATLRRWAVAGRIHRVRSGRAYFESLYTREPQPATMSSPASSEARGKETR
jgi:hypothetical protein